MDQFFLILQSFTFSKGDNNILCFPFSISIEKLSGELELKMIIHL